MQYPFWISAVTLTAEVTAQANVEVDANLVTTASGAKFPNIIEWRFPNIIKCTLQSGVGSGLGNRDYTSAQVLRWV